ncbi:MAG: MFS transporter [Lachnospiraceae bacterium]|nr:MFS transporter [Lachnospiraceae bacterium]
MVSLLLAIIYLAFISLGLPDSLLGASWPIMHKELSVPLSYAGMLSMIISGGTIISSIFSDALTRKLGTGLVTAISVLLTACALFGFSISNSFVILCILGIPYGLGAGTIDAALNNYVALHYSSRHMSWLHCFWGVGASVSPYIMGYALSSGLGWRNGYGIISVIQIVLTIILFLSLPLWQKRTTSQTGGEASAGPLGLMATLKLQGVITVLLIFFSYCAFESTAGLWISSYLVENRGMAGESAAIFGSLFYLGITIGRFVCGFITNQFGDKAMIRIGSFIMLLGVIFILIPLNTSITALIGIIIIGLGAAPVYPSLIHATPNHFGKENSQAIIGIQMASAYIGTTLMPPLFGLLAEHISIALYPIYLLLFLILMIVFSEKLNKVVAK